MSAGEVHRRLLVAGATVAVAESLTGGLVTAALTSTPGSSATLRGGLVVYATDLKASLAGVSADLLAARGAVDPDVATALARGARERLSASYGIGVTGVAGPDPQDGVPVGTIYIAIADERGATVFPEHVDGDRDTVRRKVVEACLSALLAFLDAPR